MRRLALVMSCLALCGCGSAYEERETIEPTDYSLAGGDAESSFDEEAAREAAEEEVASEGYSGPCTSDCSGHDAGFAYAAEGNPDGGTSRSPSFDEGQVAYEQAVEERVEEAREAYVEEEEQW